MGCKLRKLIAIPAEAEDCILQRVKTKPEAHPASCSKDTGGYFPGGKRSWSNGDHPRTLSAEV
jgi:hypothetical protein